MSKFYKRIFLPLHPNSDVNGIMLEHRYKAELIIKRPLRKDEVVHHKDENKLNNEIENLMVFKDKTHHARYHSCKGKGVFHKDKHNVYTFRKIKLIKHVGSGLVKYYSLKGKKNMLCKNNKKSVNIDYSILKNSIELLLEDHNKKYVSDYYGVTTKTVNKWIRRFGIINKKESETERKIVEEYLKCNNIKHVCNKFSVGNFYVKRILRDNNIEILSSSAPIPVEMYLEDNSFSKIFVSKLEAYTYLKSINATKSSTQGSVTLHINQVIESTREYAYGYKWRLV